MYFHGPFKVLSRVTLIWKLKDSTVGGVNEGSERGGAWVPKDVEKVRGRGSSGRAIGKDHQRCD